MRLEISNESDAVHAMQQITKLAKHRGIEIEPNAINYIRDIILEGSVEIDDYNEDSIHIRSLADEDWRNEIILRRGESPITIAGTNCM